MAIVKRPRLADSVIAEIKRMISSGELKEGDKLPNQFEFAAQLGVSRPSLREALHILTLIGVIEQRPGAGTIIKSTVPEVWAKHLSPPLISDEDSIIELIRARRYIEEGSAELAAQNASPENIIAIEKLIAQMKLALKNDRNKEYSELDMEFHYNIAIASNNRYILHMFVLIRSLMEQFITVLPGRMDRSIEFHIGVCENIKNKNASQAAKYMKTHILDIEKALISFYKKQRS